MWPRQHLPGHDHIATRLIMMCHPFTRFTRTLIRFIRAQDVQNESRTITIPATRTLATLMTLILDLALALLDHDPARIIRTRILPLCRVAARAHRMIPVITAAAVAILTAASPPIPPMIPHTTPALLKSLVLPFSTYLNLADLSLSTRREGHMLLCLPIAENALRYIANILSLLILPGPEMV